MGEKTKKHLLKKYWWGVLAIVIILLSLPLFLNWAVTRDTIFDCKIAGDSKDWLLVWITYLSVLSSMAMVIITYISLRNGKEQNDKILQQNKEQLEEIKKERQEDLLEKKEIQRARLVFDIITYRRTYYLRIRNIGKDNAFNVSINVNEDFIQNLEFNDRIYFEVIKLTFYVPTDTPKYFRIGIYYDIKERWDVKNIPLSLSGTYCNNYQINENLDLHQFIGKPQYDINDELTTAFKEFDFRKITQDEAIQKCLDSIAKNIKKYVDYISEEESDHEDKK